MRYSADSAATPLDPPETAMNPSADAAPGGTDEAPPAESSGLPIVHLLGLLLAAVVLLTLWLRSSAVEPSRTPPRIADRAASTTMPAAARTTLSSPPPLMRPFEQTLPDREPLAGLQGALERFGDAFNIRHPGYLPADIMPFTVNWQPDADSGRRLAGYGELLSWFYSNEHGAVLVLAQGRGVGVRPLTATADRAGRLRLADGTEVIWVVGHPIRVTASAGEPSWEGTELTLGVQATDGEGWYLRSPLVSLPELIRIAESLQRVASSE
jgi:hypothetical protein